MGTLDRFTYLLTYLLLYLLFIYMSTWRNFFSQVRFVLQAELACFSLYITMDNSLCRIKLSVYVCGAQLKAEAEAELKTAQEGCAHVLAVLDARDCDV